MGKIVLGTSKDGTIEYLPLTKEYVSEAIEHLRENFYKLENVCKAIGIAKDPKAVHELDQLVYCSIDDGLCLVGIEKATNKIVAVFITKLQKQEDTLFEELVKSYQQPSTVFICDFLQKVEGSFNTFETLKIDCLLDLMFLSVDKNYGRRNIGTELCEVIEMVVRKQLQGENILQVPEGTFTRLPRVFTAIGTTFKTQRLFKKLGYTSAGQFDYSNFVYNNKTLAENIEKETSACELVYKIVE